LIWFSIVGLMLVYDASSYEARDRAIGPQLLRISDRKACGAGGLEPFTQLFGFFPCVFSHSGKVSSAPVAIPVAGPLARTG
jgi:hypothetical protein